jgi:hypothetical protein
LLQPTLFLKTTVASLYLKDRMKSLDCPTKIDTTSQTGEIKPAPSGILFASYKPNHLPGQKQ